VLDVLVERHNIDVLKSNVDAYARFTIPEEVSQLLAVRRIVGGLELASCVEILNEHIRRRVDLRF